MRMKDICRQAAAPTVKHIYTGESFTKMSMVGTKWRRHLRVEANDAPGGDYRLDWQCEFRALGKTCVDIRVMLDETTPIVDPNGDGFMSEEVKGSLKQLISKSGFANVTLSPGDHTVDIEVRNYPVAAQMGRKIRLPTASLICHSKADLRRD